MSRYARHLLAASLLAATAIPAPAGELVHRFVNPNFGGNPLNGTFLLGEAAAQNDYKEPVIPITPRNPVEDFQRQITSRLLSLASQQIADRIYGLNPQDAGSFQIDDVGINFTREGDQIRLNIVNAADGSATEIMIPAPTF